MEKKGGDPVEDKILEAFNETYNGGFTSFEEIKKAMIPLKYWTHGWNMRVS